MTNTSFPISHTVTCIFFSLQGVDSLLKVIFGKAQPKRFGTQVVTGPVLAGLVEAYVGAINNGAVPTISTAWQVRQKYPYLT